jgi:thioredoxin reductase (NADPH)
MMHYAALLAEAREDQENQGFGVDKQTPHEWNKLVKNVQMHIKSLNFGYKGDLLKLKIKYFNMYAKFIDAHTVELEKDGKVERHTAEKIVIAVGGRPSYPGIPGD